VNLADVGSIASIVSLPAAVITVAAWLRSTGAARKLILLIALPIAIAAYTLDIGDRFGWFKLSKGELVEEWGRHAGSLFVLVNSQLLREYKDNFKMMLILNVPYTDTDRMTDTAIEKSEMFIITGEPTYISVPLLPKHKFRVVPPPNINVKAGDVVSVMMNFNLVVVPNNSSAEQIRSLSDVERVGGKILSTRGADTAFTIGIEKQGG
jgi:hypothetical protein